MRRLFEHDFGNVIDEKAVTVHEAKAIVIRHGAVLLLYSREGNCYFFPTAVIAPSEEPCSDETVRKWLCETVKSLSGLELNADAAEEYGETLRCEEAASEDVQSGGEASGETVNTQSEGEASKNAQSGGEALGQTVNVRSEYYIWKLEDEVTGELPQSTEQSAFVIGWFDAFGASCSNRYSKATFIDCNLLKQERDVLDKVDLTVRQTERIRHERDTILAFGHPEYLDMLEFVGRILENSASEDISSKVDINYSRFEHTKRVLAWALRLYKAAPDREELRKDDIMIATIFHDVGRREAEIKHISHAEAGVPITREYLQNAGYDAERIDYICMLVGRHSDKYMMENENVDRGLLLLMEADLLDDMGAQGIVMDCMITESRNPRARFTDCLDHMTRFTRRIQQYNPMVTAEGRQMWEKKTKLVEAFIDDLSEDLIL